MQIGFSRLEDVLLRQDYEKWLVNNVEATRVQYSIRRRRAIAAYEGKNPDDVYPIEKHKQQAYLDFLTKESK